jgi:hypothetical protein
MDRPRLMNGRVRAGTGDLTHAEGCSRGRPLKADEPPHERVVTGVSRVDALV